MCSFGLFVSVVSSVLGGAMSFHKNQFNGSPSPSHATRFVFFEHTSVLCGASWSQPRPRCTLTWLQGEGPVHQAGCGRQVVTLGGLCYTSRFSSVEGDASDCSGSSGTVGSVEHLSGEPSEQKRIHHSHHHHHHHHHHHPLTAERPEDTCASHAKVPHVQTLPVWPTPSRC
jgi:hypothetical protein